MSEVEQDQTAEEEPIAEGSAGVDDSWAATIGALLFVGLCGMPALELTGFGFGLPITLNQALLCSLGGGAVGGMLLCRKPVLAGLIGGVIAGPMGLLAVYYYSGMREQIWNLELVIVQGVASLPGLGVAKLLMTMMPASDDNPYADEDAFRDTE